MKKEAILYRIVRPIVEVLFKTIFTPKIIGKENIPKTGRIILAGNHTNNLDCFMLMSSTKRPIHFLAKIELWKGPKKIIFGNMGLIPINRKEKNHQSLKLAYEYLNDEKLIGIFPEGTTEKEKGVLLPFKIGAVKMAKETNTKIVPFAISGNYHPFSRNLQIKFDAPLSITEDLEKEKERLKDQIDHLLRGDL